jgi:hypothetical protein
MAHGAEYLPHRQKKMNKKPDKFPPTMIVLIINH